MKKSAFFPVMILVGAASVAAAQNMPPPRAMPRLPVSHENLALAHDQAPSSRQAQGPAAIMDGERLRVNDLDLRLFGVVPPQLSANFGPQARAALDNLANGQIVTCQIRDRDRDGRLLATCVNSAGLDMALDLLKRGLAVTARGSLTGTDLSAPYLAAEQAAQNQKLGLWSTATPSAVSVAAAAPIMAAPVKPETPKADSVAQPDAKAPPHIDKPSAADAQAKISADLVKQHDHAEQAQIDANINDPDDQVGFFERYQILIAGFLMLATALSIIAAVWAQKRRDRRDEIKAAAAALRGELMAARAICFGRMKSIASEEDDQAAHWPRIRATLYQAYVGRLGLLGAELARQIASIYGQAGDYASLYGQQGGAIDTPKKQALESICRHIDEVLPRLAMIEQTGHVAAAKSRTFATPPRAAAQQLPPREFKNPPDDLLLPETGQGQVLSGAAAAPSGHDQPAESRIPQPAASANAMITLTAAPVALWEALRGFMQNHRHASLRPGPQDSDADPHVAAYAAMIEADMARHTYSETAELLDITPHQNKKQV